MGKLKLELLILGERSQYRPFKCRNPSFNHWSVLPATLQLNVVFRRQSILSPQGRYQEPITFVALKQNVDSTCVQPSPSWARKWVFLCPEPINCGESEREISGCQEGKEGAERQAQPGTRPDGHSKGNLQIPWVKLNQTLCVLSRFSQDWLFWL